MKKFLAAAAIAILSAAPAFAASTTISFAGNDGTTVVWTLGDDGFATSADGTKVAYTWNEGTRTLCAKMTSGDLCATFSAVGTKVGDTATYTTTAGGAGTATITAMTE
jgi:hypothetical protein